MSNLKSTIERLAADFAVSIIAALRSASIDELTGIEGRATPPPARRAVVAEGPARKRGRGGRLGRRSPADIGRMVDDIVSLLQKNSGGLRAEQIRDALQCQAKELPRPLADALKEGRISKTGQKRATTYFAGSKAGAGAKRRSAKKRSKRG